MPVNDFEKQVQQKMDELQLHPSGQVWEEVEKQIRKDKKRRALFFWLPLLALLLCGSAVWLFITKKQQAENTIISKQQAAVENTAAKKNATISNTSAVPSEKIGQAASTTIENSTATNTTGTTSDNLNTIIQKRSAMTQPGNETINYTINQAPKAKQKVAVDKDFSETAVPEKQPDPAIALPVESDKQKTGNPVLPERNKETVATTNLPVPKDSTVAKDSATISIDSVIVTPEVAKQVSKKRNKWEWGFELQPGLSNTKRGDLFNMDKELYAASPNLSAGNSFVPFAPPVLIESPREHLSLGIKLSGQRKLSKKLSLQAGVQYAYLSTKVKVGSLIHTQQQLNNDISAGVTIDQYYSATNGSGSSYINKYHFAGLSAGLSWRIISKKKFSLYWDNTVAVNQLLHTNALLFDGTIRGYYNDFNAFNKTELFISSGLSVPLLQQKKFTLMGTAFVSYGLTPVLKKSTDLNSHLLNYGIGLKFLFHRL